MYGSLANGVGGLGGGSMLGGNGGNGKGSIEIVNIYDGASVDNGVGGYAVYGGTGNGGNGTGIIETANIYGGDLRNGHGGYGSGYMNAGYGGNGTGIIETANVYSGTLINGARGGYGDYGGNGTGIVEIANIYGGFVYNNGYDNITGIIGTASLNGGSLENTGGRINNLTYTGGEYRGHSYEDIGGYYDHEGNYITIQKKHEGTIGTLTVAGDATGIDWGIVDNLRFASNGSGIISIATFIEEPASTMGIMAMSFNATPNISFSGIQVMNSIDLTNGRIALDLSGLGTYAEIWQDTFTDMFAGGFNIASLFGFDGEEGFGPEVAGDFNTFSFDISWDDYKFAMVSGGSAAQGFTFSGGVITWDGLTNPTSTPEPATLVILGLGLAGLGFARRRQMRAMAV